MDDEERRIVTIYIDTDYDESLSKLKETLKRFDARVAAANEDEIQIEIAKSKLEDLCNELDLDIDDLTEEWDAYVPADQNQHAANAKSNPEIAAIVGKVDKQLADFDVNEFLENARQNKRNAEIRLQENDKVYELYIDFEEAVYVELWKLTFKHDPEEVSCKSKMLFETSFDENDLSSWKNTQKKLARFFAKKIAKLPESKHQHHHDMSTDSCIKDTYNRPGLSIDEALALDAIEEATTLQELKDAISFISGLHDIDASTHRRLDHEIAHKRRFLSRQTLEDAEYKYDERLAKEILDQILEGDNADVAQHIDYAIESHGGKVKSMRIAPDSIHVIWALNDFNADNRVYLNNLEKDVARLAEDIAHAVSKRSATDACDSLRDKIKTDLGREYYDQMLYAMSLERVEKIMSDINNDEELDMDDYHVICDLRDVIEAKLERYGAIYDAADKHIIDISNEDMREVAETCDLLDESNIRYTLSNNTLIVHCGEQTWKQLQARFRMLNDCNGGK